mgnify:CR=1 FL=1
MTPRKHTLKDTAEEQFRSRFGQGGEFMTPEGYQDELSSRILVKITQRKPQNSPRRPASVIMLRIRHASIAASLATLLFLSGYYILSFTRTSGESASDSIDSYAVVNGFLLHNTPESTLIHSLSQEDEYLADSIIHSKTLLPEGSVSCDEIIDYLIFEQTSYTLLCD